MHQKRFRLNWLKTRCINDRCTCMQMRQHTHECELHLTALKRAANMFNIASWLAIVVVVAFIVNSGPVRGCWCVRSQCVPCATSFAWLAIFLHVVYHLFIIMLLLDPAHRITKQSTALIILFAGSFFVALYSFGRMFFYLYVRSNKLRKVFMNADHQKLINYI